MAVTVPEARWRQWRRQMLMVMLGLLLATALPAVNFNHDGDYNGDGVMDPSVYNEPTGEWHVLLSGSDYEPQSLVWGGPGWKAIQADYDGDGRADVVAYNRNTGKWNVLFSRTKFNEPAHMTFGGAGWLVVTGDYDGDGTTDPTIYREATGEWITMLSGWKYTRGYAKFGGPGCTAVSGDFDGDGCSDLAVYRRSDGQWLIMFSSLDYALRKFYVDTKGDGPLVPAPADYDGDRKTDPAVFAYSAPSFRGKRYVCGWHRLSSLNNFKQAASSYFLGREDGKPSNADPAPGDYDGDGKADFALAWPDFESAHVMWRMWWSSNFNEGNHFSVIQWRGADVHPAQR